MYKSILITFFCSLIIVSCGLHNKYKHREGTIIWDNSGNAVFIPKSFNDKDLVYLKVNSNKDSLVFKSTYSKEKINISFLNYGQSISNDSLNINLSNNNSIPIGFVIIDFFKNDGDTITFTPLDENKKVHIKGVTGFIVEILGAKSQFIPLNIDNLKDTILISYEYLTPYQIRRYTYIDTIILNK